MIEICQEAVISSVKYSRYSPSSRALTPFPLTSLEGQRATFENPDHEFPQRITYWLDDDGTLHARVEREVNDETETNEGVWRRANLP